MAKRRDNKGSQDEAPRSHRAPAKGATCLVCHRSVPTVDGRSPLQCDQCREEGAKAQGIKATKWVYGPAPRTGGDTQGKGAGKGAFPRGTERTELAVTVD